MRTPSNGTTFRFYLENAAFAFFIDAAFSKSQPLVVADYAAIQMCKRLNGKPSC